MLTAEQIETMRKIHRGEFLTVTEHASLPAGLTIGECGSLALTEAGAEVLQLWEERDEARATATRLRAQLGLPDDTDPRHQTILLHANPETLADFERHGFVPGSGSLKRWLCERLADLEEARLTLAAEQGRQEGAVAGWTFDGRRWTRSHPGIELEVERMSSHPDGDPWGWEVWRGIDDPLVGFASTARAAMLAADEASAT